MPTKKRIKIIQICAYENRVYGLSTDGKIYRWLESKAEWQIYFHDLYKK